MMVGELEQTLSTYFMQENNSNNKILFVIIIPIVIAIVLSVIYYYFYSNIENKLANAVEKTLSLNFNKNSNLSIQDQKKLDETQDKFKSYREDFEKQYTVEATNAYLKQVDLESENLLTTYQKITLGISNAAAFPYSVLATDESRIKLLEKSYTEFSNFKNEIDSNKILTDTERDRLNRELAYLINKTFQASCYKVVPFIASGIFNGTDFQLNKSGSDYGSLVFSILESINKYSNTTVRDTKVTYANRVLASARILENFKNKLSEKDFQSRSRSLLLNIEKFENQNDDQVYVDSYPENINKIALPTYILYGKLVNNKINPSNIVDLNTDRKKIEDNILALMNSEKSKSANQYASTYYILNTSYEYYMYLNTGNKDYLTNYEKYRDLLIQLHSKNQSDKELVAASNLYFGSIGKDEGSWDSVRNTLQVASKKDKKLMNLITQYN
jgi:hypothetical protein